MLSKYNKNLVLNFIFFFKKKKKFTDKNIIGVPESFIP